MEIKYDAGGSIDFLMRYAKDARWDIVARAQDILSKGIKRGNDDYMRRMIGPPRNQITQYIRWLWVK